MKRYGILVAGLAAGCINGLFGAGGGMVLIPLLCLLSDLEETVRFPCSVAMMLPMCAVSLLISAANTDIPWDTALPYLLGGIIGGFLAIKFQTRIPVIWLHRILGGMILWGGVRYLW